MKHGFDPLRQGNVTRLAFTLPELLVVLGILGLLLALLMTTMSRAKQKSDNVACISNLRQSGIAVRLYAGDNNGVLPSAERLPSNPQNPGHPLPRISDLLAPYAGKGEAVSVFKCPRDRDWFYEVEGSSYQWNTSLNGRHIDADKQQNFSGGAISNGIVLWRTNFDRIQPPDSIPLLLDFAEFHPRPPKSGKNVVYMDGHAAIFEPANGL